MNTSDQIRQIFIDSDRHIFDGICRSIDSVVDLMGRRPYEYWRFVEDIGMDSLDTVEMVMAVEEEFDVDISDDLAERCIHISDAVEVIGYLKHFTIPLYHNIKDYRYFNGIRVMDVDPECRYGVTSDVTSKWDKVAELP